MYDGIIALVGFKGHKKGRGYSMRYMIEFNSPKGNHSIMHSNKEVLMKMVKALMRRHIESGTSVAYTFFDLYSSIKLNKRTTI